MIDHYDVANLAGSILLISLIDPIVNSLDRASGYATEITLDYLFERICERIPNITKEQLMSALKNMSTISYDEKTGVVRMNTR
ncbi:MAG: hypothetical protein ACYCS8_00560 [Acidithiobacillus sp.]